MDYVQVVVLSLIQGITEFLPISSSGHLVVLPQVVDWPEQGLLFDTALHVGTFFAVIIYFRKESLTIVYGLFDFVNRRATKARQLFILLCLSTVPMVIVGLCLQSIVEEVGRGLIIVGCTSIFYGVLLYYADTRASEMSKEMTWKHALVYGLFQVLAAVPGTSRSGICMTAGRFMGFSRRECARYSMLMAIPLIALIGVYGFIGEFQSPLNWQNAAPEMALGVVLSFLSAISAIHLLMKWVEKIGFFPFVVYRVLLGSVVIYIGLNM